MKTEHFKPDQLNAYTLDVESVITNYGTHSRVIAFLPNASGLYCRVDLREGLPEPTPEEVLTVARKNQGLRGKWKLESREPYENHLGPCIDFRFSRVK